MTDMQNFVMFFIDNLPDFLLSEPIIYIFGFVFAGFTVSLIRRILNL